MSVAYLIMAHSRPEQLGRLADRLLCADARVFVHVDRRAPDAVYEGIVERLPRSEAVRLVPRIRSRWSDWSLVEATLTGIETALDACPDASHVVVMSGQDYPLRSAEALVDFFREAGPFSYLDRSALPEPATYGPGGGVQRVRYWHPPRFRKREGIRFPIPRRYPAGITPWGGLNWMAIDAASARYAVDYTRAEPRLARFHRGVWAPEEHYIHTVLMNSPRAPSVRNESLWLLQWPHGPSPKVLDSGDFDLLASAAERGSEFGGRSRVKLFARKFDLAVDSAVLDRIDAELLGRPVAAWSR